MNNKPQKYRDIKLSALCPHSSQYQNKYDKDFFVSMLKNPDLDDLTIIMIAELAKARVSWEDGLLAVLCNVQRHKNLNQKVLEQVFPAPFVFNVINHKSGYLFTLLIEDYQKFSIPIIYKKEIF